MVEESAAESPPVSPAPAADGTADDQSDGAPADAAPAARTGRTVALILAGGVVATALVVGVGFAAMRWLGEDLPQVGECLTDAASAHDMTVVDCDADDAYWSVAGRDGDWTFGEFESAEPGEVCTDHPATQQALWVTEATGVDETTEGEVVCLEPVPGTGQAPGGAGLPTG